MLTFIRALNRDDIPWLFCGALLALLFAFLRFSIRGGRRSVIFPTFSIAINSVSREDNYIVYQAGGKTTELYGMSGRGKTFFRTTSDHHHTQGSTCPRGYQDRRRPCSGSFKAWV